MSATQERDGFYDLCYGAEHPGDAEWVVTLNGTIGRGCAQCAEHFVMTIGGDRRVQSRTVEA